MAYQYDALGNIIGEYESEEERLAREAREKAEREAAQAQVEKREIITRADGTQTVKTTQELKPVASPTTSLSAPITPEQVFNNMIQIESGGQQFNKQGGILTSPKGAMGIAQIMPETARNPGFGVAPATPEELATPEGNRAFGERYYQGLLKYFNGDIAKATAAYNGGAGRVQRNVQANQGQMNVAQLPKETQGYLQKALGGALNALIPSAQAGTLTEEQKRKPPTITPPGQFVNLADTRTRTTTPYQPPAPEAAPGQTTGVNYGLSTGAPSIGLKPTTFGATTPPAPESAQLIERYQGIQDNLNELYKYRAEIPEGLEWMRKRTDARIVELARQEEEKAKAQQRLDDLLARQQAGEPGAGREIAKELQNDEGSWVKMLLLSYISPTLAGAEAVKLGIFNKATTVYDASGKPAGEVIVRGDGKAVSGRFLNGDAMSKRDLLAYSGAVDDKKAHVSRADNFIDPESGQVVTKTVMSDGKERYTAGGKAYAGNPEALVPEAKYTESENRRVDKALSDLRQTFANPTQEQVQRALVAARVPNRRIELEMGLPPGSLGAGTGRQTIGGAGQPPAKTEGAPAEAPPAAATTTQPPAKTEGAPATTAAKPTVQVTPDEQPRPPTLRPQRPGEGNKEYEAYTKQENDAYNKRLEAFNNKVKIEQKQAEAFNEKQFDIQSSLRGLRNSIEILDKGEHSLGPTFNTKDFSASLPKVQQWLGEAFGTDASANTTKLLSIMNRDGLQGIKNSMGPAISNFDVDTWMKSNPVKPNMPPAEIKAWFIKTHNAMLAEAETKKKNAVKHGMIDPDFDLGKPVTGDKRPPLGSFRR
jgi:hypothetical protein